MTDLPRGWAETTLGEIAETSLGKMLDKGKATGKHPVPYLRNVNVQWGRISLDDVLTMDIPPEERKFFRLEPDDLLVCEGGEVGRCAIWQGGPDFMAFQKALHRVRPYGNIEVRYLRYLLEYLSRTGSLLPFTTGSTIKHLPQQQLRRLPIKLPPLEEQRRIVATLEDHLSRLDAADAVLTAISRRLKLLAKRVIIDAVPIAESSDWKLVTVSEAGTVGLGRPRHPDWHNGLNMRPYLRVANVFEDRIDSTDLMEMDFPPEVYEKYRLIKGDILLNEGQSPEYLGRPAMYRGDPEGVAFTNSLLRFQAGPDVLPEWALLVFRRHMHAGRFIREVRITTNIAHLSTGRFKGIEFPIPPLREQEEIVATTKERLDGVARLDSTVTRSLKRSGRLRRALLAEAFAGHLTPQDPGNEPAAMLLERIALERGAIQLCARRSSKRTPQKETLL